MDLIQGLKQDISMQLQDELSRNLMPDENVLVSLQGSFGEAFVFSNKRAFIIREDENSASSQCNVFSYPINDIKTAEVSTSLSGGYIEIKTSGSVANPDDTRVYFPSYSESAFKSAADYVNQNLTSKESKPVMTGDGSVCPKCGASNAGHYAFCPSCGAQILAICANCGSGVPYGAKNCVNCGMVMVEYSPDCSNCGGRIQRWMEFCPHCGTLLAKKCASCNMAIVDGWTYCASCGREIGSAYIDARAGRLRERIENEEGRKRDYEATISATAQSMNAEDHNKRGRELFEDGNVSGAINEFQMAVSMNQNNASYHCNLAIAYDENDQDDLALAEYEQTLQLDPNDVTALLSLGYMYNEREEMEKAEGVWNRVLSIAPGSAEAQEIQENLKHQHDL